MEGWIKLHRQLATSELWLSEPFTKGQAWVDLLVLASFQAGAIWVRGIRVPLGPGQIGWSEVKLSERWKWSRNKVRRYLDYLESKQQIFRQTKQQEGVVTTVITVTNWDLYQYDDTAEPRVSDTADDTANDTAERQQKDTNKKEEKDKNDKKKTIPRRRKSAMDDGMELAPVMRQYAVLQGIADSEVSDIFTHFKDHHLAKGSVMLDWTAAWRTWCRNHISFKGKSKAIEPKSGKPFVKPMAFEDINWEGDFIVWLNQKRDKLRSVGRQRAKKEIGIAHQSIVGKHLDGKYLDLILEKIGLKDEARAC